MATMMRRKTRLILAELVEMSVIAEGIDSRLVAKLCRRKV
jgi:hypothetical protein